MTRRVRWRYDARGMSGKTAAEGENDMRLHLFGRPVESATGQAGLEVGAAVVRAQPAGGVALELGPADGAASVRVVLSGDEVAELIAAFQAVVNGKPEAILIVDE